MSAPSKVNPTTTASDSKASRVVNSSLISRPRCSFVVTGFGPFNGVPDNPTSVLIRCLREDDSITLKSRDLIHETHILETSAEHVREKLDNIYGQMRKPSGEAEINPKENGANEAKTVIFLHLGVNYRGKHFQLEQCAYNDATFRVPDERGFKPNRQCILESGNENASHELGKCFNTTLDVQSLCQELEKGNEAVVVSKDPGRFVCNYTYCFSLDRCHTTNKECEHGEGGMHHTLFIHVPPFEVVSESRQLEFIIKVMQTIEDQLHETIK